jgi:hypothetical protein
VWEGNITVDLKERLFKFRTGFISLRIWPKDGRLCFSVPIFGACEHEKETCDSG